MSALIIGEPQRLRIAELRKLAAANPRDALKEIAIAKRDIAAFRQWMRSTSVFLPVGFAVTYTHEIQPHAPPPGLCHHLSVSVERRNRVPSIEAVEKILVEFGMKPIDQSLNVWIEDVSEGVRAINVAQLVE